MTWTDPDCPVARAADLIGDRWSLLVIRDAMDGAGSFTDFQQRTGIARNILSDRLRKLVTGGVLVQVDAPSGRRKRYALSDAGRDLFAVIVTLRQWGERHAFGDDEPHSTLLDREGRPLPRVLPVDVDGAAVGVDSTRVQKV
ncbi:helix-turn-helix domain-containing protein [Dactylosporangium sp. NPDC000244]|uniref:winged helix-turn-helix transcriptional regulator n=1 Tax=Dactylosporangium sp. NPDC000244 TaxID=3154365 RepID=UPI0033281146